MCQLSGRGKRRSPALRCDDRPRQRRGSRSPSVTEAWPLLGSTDDRHLPMSRMLLRVPGGCGADRRLILALRPECNVSGRTAQARHAEGLSLDRASPVRRIGWRPRARSGRAGTATRPRRWSIYGHGSSLAGSCGSPYGPGNGGRLALVSALKRLAAIAERFLIAGTGSAGGVPARHRGGRNQGRRQVTGEHARALRRDMHNVRTPVRTGTGTRGARAAGRTWPR